MIISESAAIIVEDVKSGFENYLPCTGDKARVCRHVPAPSSPTLISPLDLPERTPRSGSACLLHQLRQTRIKLHSLLVKFLRYPTED